jgi:hypothetical protein
MENGAVHVPDATPFVIEQAIPAGLEVTWPEPVPAPPPATVRLPVVAGGGGGG